MWAWIIAIAIAYWWHFVRETPREKEYREKQQQKRATWDKYNMNNQQNKKKESEWDKFNMDSFK